MHISWILKRAIFFENIIKLSDVDFHPTFTKVFSRFLGKQITEGQLENWAVKNSSVLPIKYLLQAEWYYPSTYIETKYDNYRMRLYKKPEESTYLDVKKSGFLIGNGDIPDLWLYIGSPVTSSISSNLDKSSAHNYFIVEALLTLFRIDELNTLYSPDIKRFLNKNKTKIDDIRKMLQFTPKLLGSASDGIAYLIGDNMVLKIFKNKFSYEKSLEAMNSLHTNSTSAKTEAMIYDAGVLGNFLDSNIYYYIMEKMEVVQELNINFRKIIEKVYEYIAKNILETKSLRNIKFDKKDLNSPIIKDEINNSIEYMFDHIMNNMSDEINIIERELKLKSTWLKSFIEEVLMKYLTNRGDLHLGNLGITNYGDLRYFDPSHSNWENDINYVM
jgi:hypothetical protein